MLYRQPTGAIRQRPGVAANDEQGPADHGAAPDADDSSHDRIRKMCLWDNVTGGGALWHEDIHDPGDACIVNVKLKSEDDQLYFYFTPLGESFDRPIVFKKR